MATSDLFTLTVAELLDGYAESTFSPVDVVECLLARIATLNPLVHAFITVTAEQALQEARRCEAELARGYRRGPLHGIPFAAKDLFDSAGIRTTYGSKIFADHVPSRDATAIRRLKQAGAILLGKTATHEFAWGITTVSALYGATRNPWQLDRVAGGSSGGSAVALATRMVPAALGTDTGGSIRIPAGFCGVVGLKPTYGRVSAAGVFPLVPSLDHPGPMARSVDDAALLLYVLAGFEPGDASTAVVPVPDYTTSLDAAIKDLRVGVCPDLNLVPLSASVQQAFDRSVGLLSALGATIVEVSLPSAPLIGEAFRAIQQAEAYHVHHRQHHLFPAQRSRYGVDVAERLDLAATAGLSSYLEALQVQRQVKADFARLLEQQVDVLLTPVSAGSPALVGEESVLHRQQEVPFRGVVLPFTIPQNVAGIPACTLRAGFDEEGIPIGVQLSGPPWREDLVLRVCHALYQAWPEGQHRWPDPRA